MKTSTRLRLACVVTLALLVLSSAFVLCAASARTPSASMSAQNANTKARRKTTRRRRARRRAAAPAAGAVPVAVGVGTDVNTTGPTPVVGEDEPPPPPKPLPTPKSVIVSGGVLNGKAISKPSPSYPPLAKAAGAEGVVSVQILVDEEGRVISASALSGHPLLKQAAVVAARQARFAPTMLEGQPVKVSGVLTYNFVLNPPTPY